MHMQSIAAGNMGRRTSERTAQGLLNWCGRRSALVAFIFALAQPAQALAPPPGGREASSAILRVGDAGIDIVRIPPKTKASSPPQSDKTVLPPPAPSGPDAPRQLGRFYQLAVRLARLPGDAQKGWMGVKLDVVDPPMARSLGLANANGALIVEATPGGPAQQAGIRFGDIVVSMDALPLVGLGELRQRVASAAPGTQLMLEVWRASEGDGDFMQMLRRLAEGGNADIMYRLGRIYALGIGVSRDEVEAVRWYRRGAAASNAAAMAGLGQMLIEGRGTGKDPEEGLRWLQAAIDKGSTDAMYAVGQMALEGRGVNKDPSEAVRLFSAAAEAGHAAAMVELGLIYDNANGVPADYVKAAHWYRRAADLGNSAGMVNLGYLYARGKGVEQNDALATSWYRKAVADGNAAGMHNLAVMADGGRGMNRDPEFAASLMLQALEAHYDFSYRQMTQASRNWSRDFRRALQRRLHDAGVYSGNLDGEFGDTTIRAIDAFIHRSR